MRVLKLLCVAIYASALNASSSAGPAPSTEGVASPASLRAFHDLLGSEPHVAGTPGDERTIERLRAAFTDMGLEVEVHEFWPLLCRPLEAKLEIVESPQSSVAGPSFENLSPDESSALPSQPGRRGVISLPLREDNLLQDPAAAHPDLTYGWNAYSGSGDVTAEVVYANYGARADFDRLRELGVDCAGKIVIARYGGNFRGYKAKFAEEAGAAGLIIYTDPADSGYAKGLMYPEGGWANATCIQRGSLLTLPYAGDPLTPFVPATKDAPRLDIDKVDLPKIPVQPVGFAAAHAIMSKMSGGPVPKEWQGGLPFTYRLTGGAELKVRLVIKQERAIARTANVIGRLRGREEPDREIVVGCHHDAWGFGAADPLAGTICLLETARVFADKAKSGWRPRRTLVFAAWGAEEFGILGSTEWCEANADDLMRNGVAYINLDMAAMGPRFGASCSPSLRDCLVEASKRVRACGQDQKTIFEQWRAQATVAAAAEPERAADLEANVDEVMAGTFSELGGGSDHVAFYCRLGIASCSFGGSGGEGTSYHSNYDTLAWYRKVVGDDYEPARMVSDMTVEVASLLADDARLPLQPWRTLDSLASQVERVQGQLEDIGLGEEARSVLTGARRRAAMCRDWFAQFDPAQHPDAVERGNQALLAMDRSWLGEGLVDRPWFRGEYATVDPDSGYATLVLPSLQWAILNGSFERIRGVLARYEAVLGHFAPPQ